MRTDEEILYDCYHKLYEKGVGKKKKMSPTKDRQAINSITQKSSKLFAHLSGKGEVPGDIGKNVMSAKGLYLHYAHIKGRNPGVIDSAIDVTMKNLIRAVCRQEAKMIREIRQQEAGGDRIDIEDFFNDKKNLNLLISRPVNMIVLECIRGMTNPIGFVHRFYITETGKKYHRKDCPFCRGRSLTATSSIMVRNQKLSPCKCLTEMKPREVEEPLFVTAFIDESIRPIQGDENGKMCMIGSYSYIICNGFLKGENEIDDENKITEGVELVGEENHIEKVTEEAVGKVLLSLAYDYGFSGQVQIYTDNKTVTGRWRELARNRRIAELFSRVDVSYVPRERNTKADKLGRKRMLLDMPATTYNKIVKKLAMIKDLERKIEELESEKVFTMEIPEVIVAKTVKVC